MSDHTLCRTCNRVVWVKDVDEDGDCVDHRDAKRREQAKPKPAKGSTGK